MAFFDGRRGSLSKIYAPWHRQSRLAIRITCDASPWGFGATLEVAGVLTSWFAEPISQFDVERFSICVGQSRHQALLECLAVLIAVRLWLPTWREEQLTVVVRSDSTAALAAFAKQRSTTADISAVVRELALDCAEGRYRVEVLQHIEGRLNFFADILSRQAEGCPDRKPIPASLRVRPRAFPPQRDESWWVLGRRPGGEPPSS